MSQSSQNRLIQFIVVSMTVVLGASAAAARPRVIVVDPGWRFFVVAPPYVTRHSASRTADTSKIDLELQRELQRELRRMPPQSDERIQTAALPPDPELQRELQRELHRMPPPAVPEDLACAERLAKIARYAMQPNRAGPAECGAVDLVRLDSIVMPDKARVSMQPPPMLRCSMAQAVAEWIRDDVGPVAAELGAALAAVATNDSYDCRSRNNVKGAKLSEHARGNALDINAIRLGNGDIFKLSDRLVSQPFRKTLREAACGRFTTVLGPGSDSYHEEHIHLDLAERSHGNRMCQWDMGEQLSAQPRRTPPRDPKGPAAQARDANAKASIRPKTTTAPTRGRRR